MRVRVHVRAGLSAWLLACVLRLVCAWLPAWAVCLYDSVGVCACVRGCLRGWWLYGSFGVRVRACVCVCVFDGSLAA